MVEGLGFGGLGLYRGYIGIMEQNMTTIIIGLYRVSGCGVEGLGFSVWDLGFGVEALKFGVWDLGYRI